MRRLIPLVLVLVLAGCATPAPSPAPTPTPAEGMPAAVARLINRERARESLPALVRSDPADAMARSWAASMAAAEVLTHGVFGDRLAIRFPNHAGGEDIASGQPDPASVVAAWMSDPPHRANILGPFTALGVGEALSPKSVPYWCVDFIR